MPKDYMEAARIIVCAFLFVCFFQTSYCFIETLFFHSTGKYEFLTCSFSEENRKLSNSEKEGQWGVIKVGNPEGAESRAQDQVALKTFPAPMANMPRRKQHYPLFLPHSIPGTLHPGHGGVE